MSNVENFFLVHDVVGRVYDLIGLVTDVEGLASAPIDAVHLRVRARDGSPLVVVASIEASGQLESTADCSLRQLDAWADVKWTNTVDLASLVPNALETRRKLALECANRYHRSGYFAFQVTRLRDDGEELKFFEPGELDEI